MREYGVGVVVLCALLGGCGESSEGTHVAEVSDNSQVQARGADKDDWWDKLPRPEWSAFEKIEQDQDWFEVYLVADDVYAIYEPGQFEEVMSFLILGGEQALLFDTGLGIGDMRRGRQSTYRARRDRVEFAHALRPHRQQLPV